MWFRHNRTVTVHLLVLLVITLATMAETKEEEMSEMKLTEKYIEFGVRQGYKDGDLRDYVARTVKGILDRRERAEERRAKAEEETRKAELEQKKAEVEQKKAEAEQRKAEEETKKAELMIRETKIKADAQQKKAEEETKKAELMIRETKIKTDAQIEIAKLQAAQHSTSKSGQDKNATRPRYPKLPNFKEESEHIDSYLFRFEQHALAAEWPKESWPLCLSAHLEGPALDLYHNLNDGIEGPTYQVLKESLLKRFQCTAEGFRLRFRQARPDTTSPCEIFAMDLRRLLERWLSLSKVSDFEGIKDLLLQEQFIDSVSKDLSVFLIEKNVSTFAEMIKQAENFRMAHPGKSIARRVEATALAGASYHTRKEEQRQAFGQGYAKEHGGGLHKHRKRRYWRDSKPYLRDGEQNKKKSEGSSENRSKNNPPNEEATKRNECFVCGSKDHFMKNCPNMHNREGFKHAYAVQANDDYASDSSSSASCAQVICSSIQEHVGKLKLESGTVNSARCSVLRDTGANVCGVRKRLVNEDQYTGKSIKCVSFGGRVETFELAEVTISTQYLEGKVTCCVLEAPVADLIIGNVPGISEVSQATSSHEAAAAAVVTRARAKHIVAHEPLQNCADTIKVSREELCSMQKEDQSLQDCFKLADTGEVKKVGSMSHFFFRDSGLLLRRFTVGDRTIDQVVVPKQLRPSVLAVSHDLILSGHCGSRRTLTRLRERFYWPGVTVAVAKYVASCDACQKATPKGRVPPIPLASVPLIGTPFDRVAIDLVGPFTPASDEGHRYILTLIDIATRFPEAVPLKDITSVAVAEALFQIFSRMGFPKEILSDRGTQFVSDLMQEFHKLCGCRGIRTSPYHPQANGNVERFHGTLKAMLRKVIQDKPRQWNRFIPALLFAYRELPCESTGFSPFRLLFGREVRGPVSLLCDVWTETEKADGEQIPVYAYVFDLQNKIRDTCQIAMSESQKQSAKNKKIFDRKAKQRSFQTGEEVLVLLPSSTNKLLSQWKGPYKVLQNKHPDYIIRMGTSEKLFHANMLKRYTRREPVAASCTHCDSAGQSGNLNEEKDPEQEQKNPDPWMDIGPVDYVSIHRDRSQKPHTQHQQVEAMAMTGVIQDDDDTGELATLEASTKKEDEDIRDIKYGDDLSEKHKANLQSVFQEFNSIMTAKPGCFKGDLMLEIKLTTDVPVRKKMYGTPFSSRQVIEKEIQSMLDLGVIEKSKSAFAAPVVLVLKKDGTYRFCIDFRALNKITEFDAEPIPNVDSLFAELSKAKIFTRIDLSKGYWQIVVKPEDRPKTAFATHMGLFQFTRMPFGLVSAPAMFARMMRLLCLDQKSAVNFFDDILVHSECRRQHATHVRQVLQKLSDAGLTARPTKVEAGVRSLEFLGHIIGAGTIRPESGKISKILEIAVPRTKKQVRSLLGLIGFYRQYVPNYAELMAPLTNLTKETERKNKAISWNPECQKALTAVQKILSEEPVLILPRLDQDFTLRTDASSIGLGGVLLQSVDGKLHPVRYAGRKLLDRETRYSTIERECLAIVWAIQKFVRYLHGRKFVLQTDHRPLTFLRSSSFKNGRVMRWALQLQEFAFDIKPIEGEANTFADILSRADTDQVFP